jgi:hypothetical protein
MLIVFAALVGIIIFMFWQTIYIVISSYASHSKTSSKLLVGNIWFILLLVMNIIIILFIYLFYYYKSTEKGIKGLNGERGFNGYQGEPCTIKNDCTNLK